MNRLFSVSAALSGALALAVLVLSASALAGVFGSGSGETPPELAKKLNQPVPESLVATLKKASKVGLTLGTAPQNSALKMINGPRLGSGEKVGLFYMGADFCPYCAGQRWALVLTLVRFGEFKGLQYMLSSPTDVYANTPTFSFQHASYTSDYVSLRAVETADRKRKKLMTLSKEEQKIATKFDAPPYAPYFGGIPFIYLDGQYMLARPMVSPASLAGKNWRAVADTFADPQSKLFQTIMPKVNALTAAICRLDGGSPDEVCSAPGVIAANGVLLKLSANGS